MHIEIAGIDKVYQKKIVFSKLSWRLEKGIIHVVTGPNGSGKSTLLRLISGLERPTGGKVIYSINGKTYGPQELRNNIGLASPDLNMYSQLSPQENLHFFAALRGYHNLVMPLEDLLKKVQLESERERPVVTFSSGMKKRLKLALAILHEPCFLFLDEPTSNLDEAGKELVADIIREQAQRGIILIATNEPGEVQRFGQKVLHLDKGNQCPG